MHTPTRTAIVLAVALLATTLFSGCMDIITAVTGIPDAENSLVTSDGRLFVTSYNNVYEIIKPGTFYQKKELIRSDEDRLYDPATGTTRCLGNGDFLGIAEYNQTVYIAFRGCNFQSYIVAYDLETGDRSIVHRLTQVTMPNGIAFDAAGRLYINDQVSLSLKLGRIIRLVIDHARLRTSGPGAETLWLNRGVNLPNGMLYHKGALVITDLNAVKRIPILSSGAPGTVSTIYTRSLAVLDDLEVYGDNFVVCDFTKGTVFELSAAGRILQELPAGSVKGPSSVALGYKTNNLFPDDAVVVTAKGVLLDRWSAIGNSLVYFLMP